MNIEVESFKLDHTQVDAPYVREAEQITTPQGDTIQKYDLRLVQPNQEAISTAALHTLEHLLAGFMREKIDNVVDISPMGCRTGFYLIKVGKIDLTELERALITSLKEVLGVKVVGEVPATTAKECGNYRDHSLFGAKEYAQQILSQFNK